MRTMDRRDFVTGIAAGGLAALTYGLASSADPQTKASAGLYGIDASLRGMTIFPADNWWNYDVSKESVDPASDTLIASIGANRPLHADFGSFWRKEPIGIPYIVVPGDQPRVPVRFLFYAKDSDPGPYPIPPDAPIEGGPTSKEDRHVIVVDRDHGRLYELFKAYQKQGVWSAGCGAVFDLTSNRLRPAGLTSADAAGLPILPGLVRYDEVYEQKEIRHALRFTARRTRKAYVAPARHFASRSADPRLPPMGMRVRLKADFNMHGFSEPIRVILTALKKYGMFLADNGSNWFVSGTHDPRWDNDVVAPLRRLKGRDFEVVKMGQLHFR